MELVIWIATVTFFTHPESACCYTSRCHRCQHERTGARKERYRVNIGTLDQLNHGHRLLRRLRNKIQASNKKVRSIRFAQIRANSPDLLNMLPIDFLLHNHDKFLTNPTGYDCYDFEKEDKLYRVIYPSDMYGSTSYSGNILQFYAYREMKLVSKTSCNTYSVNGKQDILRVRYFLPGELYELINNGSC